MKPDERLTQVAVTLVKMAISLLEEARRELAAARLREVIELLERPEARRARRDNQ